MDSQALTPLDAFHKVKDIPPPLRALFNKYHLNEGLETRIIIFL